MSEPTKHARDLHRRHTPHFGVGMAFGVVMALVIGEPIDLHRHSSKRGHTVSVGSGQLGVIGDPLEPDTVKLNPDNRKGRTKAAA